MNIKNHDDADSDRRQHQMNSLAPSYYFLRRKNLIMLAYTNLCILELYSFQTIKLQYQLDIFVAVISTTVKWWFRPIELIIVVCIVCTFTHLDPLLSIVRLFYKALVFFNLNTKESVHNSKQLGHFTWYRQWVAFLCNAIKPRRWVVCRLFCLHL